MRRRSHQTNLEKPEAVTACANRKAVARKKHAASSAATAPGNGTPVDQQQQQQERDEEEQQPKYFDRAAARRSTYNQADHPEPPTKRKKFDGPEPPAPIPEAPNKDGLDESNTGMKMLEKMVSFNSSDLVVVAVLGPFLTLPDRTVPPVSGVFCRVGRKGLDWERRGQVESIPFKRPSSPKEQDSAVQRVRHSIP